MSAMWELREGLRKRGESWHKWPDKDSTTWQAYSNPHTATESMDGTLIVTGLTPEQAIEATLGRGECRFVTVVDQDPSRRHRGNIAECDCCGYRCAIGFIQDERFRYCPNCGAKVVDE